MIVLVTGASGFLGLKLVEELVDRDFDVIAISRTDLPVSLSNHTNLRWIVGDLNGDLAQLDLPKLSAVIHLAGKKDGSNEKDLFESNEQVLINLVESLKGLFDVFIFASSQMIYGPVNSTKVDEASSLSGASSAYACSKLNAENWLAYFQKKYGGSYFLLRYTGFVDGGGLVDYLIDRALSDDDIELLSKGSVKRDYLHSSDAINSIVAAIRVNLGPGVFPINIGSGDIVSTLQLAQVVCSEIQSNSRIKLLAEPAPKDDFVFDIKKARSILGFKPMGLTNSVKKHSRDRLKVYKGIAIDE
jgi:nucleoside-diphosphate-sugar epimerase